MTVGAPSYKGFRFPAGVISHCVWLYHRFLLSFGEVEEMMLERASWSPTRRSGNGATSSSQAYANTLRRRRPRPGNKWHLDEVFIKVNGKTHYLWRALDQDRNILDILVTSRGDTTAATRVFPKTLTGWQYVPGVLVTDKSPATSRRRVLPSVQHRRSKYLNNRAENSHQPTRAREQARKEIHLNRACATVSVRVQWDIAALSTGPSPAARRRTPPRNNRPVHLLKRRHGRGHRRLSDHTKDPPAARSNTCPCTPGSPNKLTVPAAALVLLASQF
ncbi:MAG: IS6 family transposase [Mycobacteriales bacterium]